jgi:hypothetical protein
LKTLSRYVWLKLTSALVQALYIDTSHSKRSDNPVVRIKVLVIQMVIKKVTM